MWGKARNQWKHDRRRKYQQDRAAQHHKRLATKKFLQALKGLLE